MFDYFCSSFHRILYLWAGVQRISVLTTCRIWFVSVCFMPGGFLLVSCGSRFTELHVLWLTRAWFLCLTKITDQAFWAHQMVLLTLCLLGLRREEIFAPVVKELHNITGVVTVCPLNCCSSSVWHCLSLNQFLEWWISNMLITWYALTTIEYYKLSYDIINVSN